MKKIFQLLGALFVIAGIIFLLVHSSLVTVSPNEDFGRDLFGFPIPHPPVWTSYIPYIGGFLLFIFEFFSIHGLVGIAITGIILYIGGLLIVLGSKEKST